MPVGLRRVWRSSKPARRSVWKRSQSTGSLRTTRGGQLPKPIDFGLPVLPLRERSLKATSATSRQLGQCSRSTRRPNTAELIATPARPAAVGRWTRESALQLGVLDKGAVQLSKVHAPGRVPYLPSRSESPGIARSTVSLTRCQASRVACLARPHSRLELPRLLFQSRPSSGSTSSKVRSG